MNTYLSYNKLKTFGDCALKYRLTYIERLPRKPIASLSNQRKLHAALRQYHHFAAKNGQVKETDLLEAFAHAHGADQNPALKETDAYADGEAVLRQYCRRENEKHRQAVEQNKHQGVAAMVEEKIVFGFGPYLLGGQIDRIDFAEGAAYSIIDYKLDRRLPPQNAAEKSKQLAFYHLLVQEGLGLPVQDTRLYYLRPGIEQINVCTRKQLHETVDWVDKIAGGIHAEKAWKPRLGDGCATCPYKHECPAKTGRERAQQGVWQQGNLLFEMEGGGEDG